LFGCVVGGLGICDLILGFKLIQTFGQICDLFLKSLCLRRVLRLEHGEIALLEGELPDGLICHPGDQATDNVLHALLED
jgi:hypothetical protein